VEVSLLGARGVVHAAEGGVDGLDEGHGRVLGQSAGVRRAIGTRRAAVAGRRSIFWSRARQGPEGEAGAEVACGWGGVNGVRNGIGSRGDPAGHGMRSRGDPAGHGIGGARPPNEMLDWPHKNYAWIHAHNRS
jgi:hypothetical protein